ncbi:hypothetical protein [Agreia bicolorata]|uniref:Uncharacterized protein n=1 Tax=Agreia bicolorata TaxID=110935 RepID=A0ABR5CD16_9MICO|nr:hypothetical protein [Agreia bicolorata]KJC63520.1 hypothetical protein TZ00_13190 [Agreia bicolorata]
MNERRSTIAHHLTTALILRWVAFYTRELPLDVAGERRDEIASDLYEQSMDVGPGAAARRLLAMSLAWRALRGIGADLAWRATRIRDLRWVQRASSGNGSRPHESATAVVLALATSLAVVGVLTAIRVLASPNARSSEELQLLLIVAPAAMLTGLALFARATTRPAALMVMAAASVPLTWAVGVSLWSVSATLGHASMYVLGLMNLSVDKIGYIAAVPGAALALLFFAMAPRARAKPRTET